MGLAMGLAMGTYGLTHGNESVVRGFTQGYPVTLAPPYTMG